MVNFETATNFGLDVYFGGTSGLWVGGSYFVCVFFVGAHLKAGGKYMMGLTTCHQFFCLFVLQEIPGNLLSSSIVSAKKKQKKSVHKTYFCHQAFSIADHQRCRCIHESR